MSRVWTNVKELRLPVSSCFLCLHNRFVSDLQHLHLTGCLCLQMNMLLRLQEAANYSSTQSCDSDSTSHHDDQLDSSLESALWAVPVHPGSMSAHIRTPAPLRCAIYEKFIIQYAILKKETWVNGFWFQGISSMDFVIFYGRVTFIKKLFICVKVGGLWWGASVPLMFTFCAFCHNRLQSVTKTEKQNWIFMFLPSSFCRCLQWEGASDRFCLSLFTEQTCVPHRQQEGNPKLWSVIVQPGTFSSCPAFLETFSSDFYMRSPGMFFHAVQRPPVAVSGAFVWVDLLLTTWCWINAGSLTPETSDMSAFKLQFYW